MLLEVRAKWLYWAENRIFRKDRNFKPIQQSFERQREAAVWRKTLNEPDSQRGSAKKTS